MRSKRSKAWHRRKREENAVSDAAFRLRGVGRFFAFDDTKPIKFLPTHWAVKKNATLAHVPCTTSAGAACPACAAGLK